MRDTPLDTAPAVARAVAILRRGGLVAFPTETVYGLGADAGNEAAVRRIFAVKQRPIDHPVIVHIPDAGHLPRWAARVPEAAARLAAAFWPGPLTLVLERAAGVLDAVTGGQDSVGVRVPYHPLALDLLHAFGGGLAAPSANLFGCLSPTSAEHVLAELGDQVDLVLDGGACRVGIESTIVEVNGAHPRLLRPGGIGLAAMEAVVGSAILPAGSELRAAHCHDAGRAGTTCRRGAGRGAGGTAAGGILAASAAAVSRRGGGAGAEFGDGVRARPVSHAAAPRRRRCRPAARRSGTGRTGLAGRARSPGARGEPRSRGRRTVTSIGPRGGYALQGKR